LLSIEAMQKRKINIAGFVFNDIDDAHKNEMIIQDNYKFISK